MDTLSSVDRPQGGGYFKRSVPSVKRGQKILSINSEELQMVLAEIEAAFNPADL